MIVICSSSRFVQNHDVIKITDFSTNPSLCSIFNRKQFLRTIQMKSALVTKKQRARALFREIFVDSMCTCHVSQIQKHARTCVRALVFECWCLNIQAVVLRVREYNEVRVEVRDIIEILATFENITYHQEKILPMQYVEA